MLVIFKRYRLLFFVLLPLLIFAGNAATPLAMVVLGIGVLYFLYQGRHDAIIITFIIILVLGDSRQGWLQFAKPLRVELLIMITLITISELWRGFYRFNSLFLPFLPFLVISVLALSFSPLLDVGSIKTVSFAMLYFCVLHYFLDKHGKYGLRLLEDIVYLSHFIMLLGLLMIPIFPGIVSYGGIRYNGLLGNPNGMGMFVTLTVPMTVYFFTYKRGISRQYTIFAWVLIIASLMLCSSRNAIFAFTIFLSLYHGLRGSTFTTMIFLFVVIPVAGILLFNINLESLVYSLGLEKYFRIKDFESGSGRVFAWRYAWSLVEQRPIIGCGFACEEYNFIYRTTYELWSTGHQGGVHNSYLAYIVNTGFVGFTLYFGFLASLFRRIRNRGFMIPFVASCAFSAMFESWLFSSLSAFHILFLVTTVQLLSDRFLPRQEQFRE